MKVDAAWRVAILSFFTFGLSVGLPQYALPFFYDYFQQSPEAGGIGLSRSQLMLGYPLATVLTLWIGPTLLPRISPRISLILGTGLTMVSFVFFSRLDRPGWPYFASWFVCMTGYIFSGPIPHQVLIANWFGRTRGRAMGLVYVGVGIFGALSAKAVAAPLTAAFGFRAALVGIGLITLLVWPIAWAMPRGAPKEAGPAALAMPFRDLLASRAFWLLLGGSFCSIAAIGCVNQHMKLILKEHGFVEQALLDRMFSDVLAAILLSSIVGRVLFGFLADRYPVKWLLAGVFAAVAAAIPLLMAASPLFSPYPFALIFGLAMGADYMLIPLLAAQQFGPRSVGSAMSLILPTDLVGLAWGPFAVSVAREAAGSYALPLIGVLALAGCGAVLAAGMPKHSAR